MQSSITSIRLVFRGKVSPLALFQLLPEVPPLQLILSILPLFPAATYRSATPPNKKFSAKMILKPSQNYGPRYVRPIVKIWNLSLRSYYSSPRNCIHPQPTHLDFDPIGRIQPQSGPIDQNRSIKSRVGVSPENI